MNILCYMNTVNVMNLYIDHSLHQFVIQCVSMELVITCLCVTVMRDLKEKTAVHQVSMLKH